MKNLAILMLAVLAFSAAASAQTAPITLINDSWVVGRDVPGWQVEMVDTTDKRLGSSSLLIDSPLYNNMTGNMAVFINTEATAPLVFSLTPATSFNLAFWAKLNSQGVWKNTGQQFGQMQFQVSLLNNAFGNSGTNTGTLQQWGNANASPSTGILMLADNMWHQYVLSFTAWVNDPATMGSSATLGCIGIYHQSWNGNGFGDGTGADVLLHVDDFEILQTVPPQPHCGGEGDFNNDGVVDDADYTVWADFYNSNPQTHGHPTYRLGSAPNGGYNDADYTLWADNYDKMMIPEPACLSLLLLGGLALRRRRARA